jgi:glucose/mannose-6-phosphate isomerase
MPRAALGFLSGAAMGVLEAIGLLPPFEADVGEAERVLGSLAADLGAEAPAERNEAKSLAAWLAGRMPVVWGTEGLAAAAALRWKTQMNENAKVPAFAGILPELDHNEVEGWSEGTGAGFAVIALRHRAEHPRIAPRVAATTTVVGPSKLEVHEVKAEGFGPVESLFSLVMLGDFVSTYLGILRGVDPLAIPVLTSLKERLRQ